MCEAKFTKGEWQYEDGWGAVYTPEGFMVCEFTESNTREHKDYNAHLIAAAPEMYVMLEKVLVEYKEMLGMSPEIDEIEQLLEKVRGEHVQPNQMQQTAS